MTGYKHGAYVQEADYSIPAPKKNESGLHVFFGTAPIVDRTSVTFSFFSDIFLTTPFRSPHL